MSQGKKESKLQGNLIPYWKSEGLLYAKKTHEILSSGKPDLRLGHPVWSQLDCELKVKETGPLGLLTGVSRLQEETMNKMNLAGMPAVALVHDEYHKEFWLTLNQSENYRQLPAWRIIPAVVYKRSQIVCDPHAVYLETKRLLNERGYPSARFLNV